MQRKILLVVAAVLVVAVIGVGAFLIQSKSKSSDKSAVQTGPVEQAVGAEGSGTFKSLIGLNKNVMCEVSYASDAGDTRGTVYVAGNKMRGDFKAAVDEGKEVESHMISDSAYMYSWSSEAPQGVKIKIESVSPSPEVSPMPKSEGVDLDQQVKYKCSSWNVDDSKFTPPSDVQFTDFSEITKGVGGQTQMQSPKAPGKSDTSQCDQFTDPQRKAACVAAVSGQ